MSYKQAVLRDNPIAFWPLNGTSTERTYATLLYEYGTYQDWLNAESTYDSTSLTFTLDEISANGNYGAFTIGDPNFLDVLPLATLSSYDTKIAGCKINSTSEIGISNLPGIYNHFYTGTENLTFGVEMWLAFDKNPSTDNAVFLVEYSGYTIAKTYVNNDKIYFTVNGKNKKTNDAMTYTVSKQLDSWDSQMHVFFYYDNRNLNIAVNGLYTESVTLPSEFIFSTSPTYKNNIFYSIGPSGTYNNFIINDLAFYDYVISTKMIRSHILWGTYDSAPQNYVKQTDGYFFDIKDSEGMYSYKQSFANPKNYKLGTITNLIADNKGLTLQTIPSLSAIGSVTTSNGLTTSSTSAAKFVNFSDYFSPLNFSMVGQIDWVPNASANPAVIFSLEGLNSNEWVYLAQSADDKLTLYYHTQLTSYPYGYTEQVIAQLDSATTTGTYNIGLSVNNKTASIYLSGTGSKTTSNFPSYTYEKINAYFGNQFSEAVTTSMSGKLKNVSILSSYTDPSAYTLYGVKDNTTITFKTGLEVSQTGTWTFSVPSSQIGTSVGSRLTWDSATSDNSIASTNKNVIAQASIDNGTTWKLIGNGDPVTRFTDSSSVAAPDTLFKVTMYTSDSSSQYLPRFDNAMIVFYNNLAIVSDGGAFTLSPKAGTYVGDTYSIKKNSFNILARSRNFGIKLNKVNNLNSVATIKANNSSKTYNTIEFWFRYDEANTLASNYIIDTDGVNASVYVDPASKGCYKDGFAHVFVNGVELTDGQALTVGESYHFVCVYPYDTNADIYLGGNKLNNYFTYGTYGFVSLYPSAFTQTQAQSRYMQFLSSNVSQVNYTELLAESTNIIGTLSEYAGGSTDYNAGQPILSYKHPTTANV